MLLKNDNQLNLHAKTENNKTFCEMKDENTSKLK